MNVRVPADQLQPQTLRALIEDFVTRDGAVQGHHDQSLADKAQQIERALRAGEAVIVFDDIEETFAIVPSAAWHKARALGEAEDESPDQSSDESRE